MTRITQTPTHSTHTIPIERVDPLSLSCTAARTLLLSAQLTTATEHSSHLCSVGRLETRLEPSGRSSGLRTHSGEGDWCGGSGRSAECRGSEGQGNGDSGGGCDGGSGSDDDEDGSKRPGHGQGWRCEGRSGARDWCMVRSVVSVVSGERVSGAREEQRQGAACGMLWCALQRKTSSCRMPLRTRKCANPCPDLRQRSRGGPSVQRPRRQRWLFVESRSLCHWCWFRAIDSRK